MNGIQFDKDTVIQQDGNAVSVCGPSTGHFFRVVAFCESSSVCSDIVAALNYWKKAAIEEQGKPISYAPLGNLPDHQFNRFDE